MAALQIINITNNSTFCKLHKHSLVSEEQLQFYLLHLVNASSPIRSHVNLVNKEMLQTAINVFVPPTVRFLYGIWICYVKLSFKMFSFWKFLSSTLFVIFHFMRQDRGAVNTAFWQLSKRSKTSAVTVDPVLLPDVRYGSWVTLTELCEQLF